MTIVNVNLLLQINWKLDRTLKIQNALGIFKAGILKEHVFA